MSLTTRFIAPETGAIIENAYHKVAQVSIDNATIGLCVITIEVYTSKQAYTENKAAIKRFQLPLRPLSDIDLQAGNTFLDKVYANIKATEPLYVEALID